MRVKLIQNKTHARHQTIHVRRLAILIPSMCSQCTLERLKVVHPVDCKVVWLCVSLVEDEDEWQACLVEDSIQVKAIST